MEDSSAPSLATAPDTPETPTPTPPQLTLNDLQAVLVVVESACQRGTFKAPEMKGIGDLYERIQAYVKHTSQQ